MFFCEMKINVGRQVSDQRSSSYSTFFPPGLYSVAVSSIHHSAVIIWFLSPPKNLSIIKRSAWEGEEKGPTTTLQLLTTIFDKLKKKINCNPRFPIDYEKSKSTHAASEIPFFPKFIPHELRTCTYKFTVCSCITHHSRVSFDSSLHQKILIIKRPAWEGEEWPTTTTTTTTTVQLLTAIFDKLKKKIATHILRFYEKTKSMQHAASEIFILLFPTIHPPHMNTYIQIHWNVYFRISWNRILWHVSWNRIL